MLSGDQNDYTGFIVAYIPTSLHIHQKQDQHKKTCPNEGRLDS